MQIDHHVFYGKLRKLATPIAFQSLMLAAVAAGDALMLGSVAQNEMTAVSLATQIQFVQNMFLMAVTSAGAILGAQYWGRNDRDTVRSLFNMMLRWCGVISLVFFTACELCPELLMKMFSHDGEIIEIGSAYLRIAGWSYLITGVSQSYLTTMKVTDHVAPSAWISSSAVVSNIILNGIFIFGLFGAPKMGAAGVALATSLSRIVELALALLVSARSQDVKLKARYFLLHNPLLFKDFLKMALPALVNDVSWGLAFSLYSVIIGQFLGSDMVAANSFVTQVRSFATVLCFSVASAGGILLGQIIGSGEMEEAEQSASAVMRLTVASGAIGGVLILLFMRPVLAFADLTPLGKSYLRTMLFINSYYVMGAAVNTTLIAGVFRAGGDSRFGMICDTIDMWCYAVPLGFFAAGVLKLPPLWVYFLLCTDEFVKWPWVIGHYRSKKWLKNITRDDLQLE